MTIVHVKDNQTGQVLNVDDSQLGQYGINSPQSPQMQSQSPTQDNSNPLASGLNSIISSILKPITDYVTEAQQKEKNATPTQKLTQAIKQSLNPLAGLLNDVQGNFDPQGGKAATDAASFVVPFGKAPEGAGILSQILSKAIPGAAVGGLSGIAQPNATPLSVENSALTGGILAPALSAILGVPGAIGGKVGNAAENIGEDLQNSVSNIRVPAAVGGAQREAQVSQTLRDIVPGNTAAAKYESLKPTMSKLGDGIQSIIDSNSKTVPTKQVISSLITNMEDIATSNNLDPKVVKSSIEDYIGKVLKYTEQTDSGILDKNGQKILTGSPLPESLTQDEVNKLRLSANNDFSKVAKKFIPGSPQTISPTDYVIDTARQTFKDILTENNPEAASLISQQHDLFDAAKSLAKSRDTRSVLSIPGTRIGLPNGIEQGAASVGGKALSSAGGALANVSEGASSVSSNPLLQSILTRGAVGGVNNVNNPSQQPNGGVDNNNQSNNIQSQGNQDNSIVPQQSNQPGQITPQMVSLAYQMLPPARAAKIKAAFDAQQTALGPKLIKDLVDKTTPLIEKAKNIGPGGAEAQAASQGILGKLGLVQPDPSTTQLGSNLAALQAQVLQEFTKRGISSQQAVIQLQNLIPNVNESKSIMKQKLAALPEAIQTILQNYGVTSSSLGQ